MNDAYYMALAIDLAKATLGQTSPNPSVGAIVVKNNQIVGIGTHLKAGMPHAEIYALNMAGTNAKGATMYISLEPCVHFGKTAPCTDAILNFGITKVVIAMLDPNPLVAGKGIQQLQQAGIKVEVGVLQDVAKKLNQAFFHYIQTKTPYITLKAAMSIDAKLATGNGNSKWITNAKAREDAHGYRRTHDAILVGVNTILADNPLLTTRLIEGDKNPIRIILDTHLRTPLNAQVITNHSAPTWIITGKNVTSNHAKAYTKLGVKIIKLPHTTIKLDKLMVILAKQAITSLLVEGGPQIHASFLDNGLFNQLILYVGSLLIGGKNAPSLFEGKEIHALQDALAVEFQSVELIENNLKIIAIPKG